MILMVVLLQGREDNSLEFVMKLRWMADWNWDVLLMREWVAVQLVDSGGMAMEKDLRLLLQRWVYGGYVADCSVETNGYCSWGVGGYCHYYVHCFEMKLHGKKSLKIKITGDWTYRMSLDIFISGKVMHWQFHRTDRPKSFRLLSWLPDSVVMTRWLTHHRPWLNWLSWPVIGSRNPCAYSTSMPRI